MTGEIPAVLGRNLPGYEVRSLTLLDEGLDNAAYEVNDELVVRKSKKADPAKRAREVLREAELLISVSEVSTLPVPEPIFADADSGVLAYRKLPGLPLLGCRVPDPTRLAPVLGEFLSRLHAAPVQDFECLVERDSYPLSAWREDAERDFRGITARMSGPSRRLVEGFLGRTPPAEPRTAAFCHNDLGAEHVLVDAGSITGIIDWTDAAFADPARDLAPIYRDLGPEVFDLTLYHYEGRFDEADRERTAFYARCMLLEDVAYGMSNPRAHRHAEAGLANLARTFA